jgi:N utilization substance protein A
VSNLDVIEALGEIARRKNLSREFVVETLKLGLLQACKKRFGTSDNIFVELEDDTGEIGIFARKTVAAEVTNPSLEISPSDAAEYLDDPQPGDEVEVMLPFEEFGRMAIQATKQILFQKVREAEREQVYKDFSGKVGDIVTGTVQQISRDDILVSLDRTEAVLPYSEQIRSERYQQGRTVRALVIEAAKNLKGPQVILSRTHPDFMKRLFMQEVPESKEGLVEVKAVSREPGDRAKVAVASRDPKVDAVGAFVGLKGGRVQAVVRELSGEKIDIVSWASDPALFVVRALSPAKGLEAFPEPEEKRMVVICPDDQYSLAIGKRGQNVRLAAKLTGWRIDVMTDSQYQERFEAASKVEISLDQLELSDKIKARLREAGLDTVEKVIAADQKGLIAIDGIGEKTAEKVLSAAKEAKDAQLMHFDEKAAQQALQPEAAADNPVTEEPAGEAPQQPEGETRGPEQETTESQEKE